jgi:putative membrane protein
MKSKIRFISRVAVTAATFFVVARLFVGAALFGQGYSNQPKPPSAATSVTPSQQEAFPPDNPFFRKKASSTPSPSATKAKIKPLSSKDTKFLSNAAASDGWEMKTGQLAENKAQNPATKQLAARMVSDHSKSNAELTGLAGKKGLSISIGGAKAQQINGPNFDKSYLNLLQQDHEEAIASFTKEAQSGDDPDIKAWAKKMLPTLKEHLSMAKQAAAKP